MENIIRYELCLDRSLPYNRINTIPLPISEPDIDHEIAILFDINKRLSIEEQYKLIKSISESDLLSILTLTKLKQKVYSNSDSLKTDIGTKLTKLCFSDIKLETTITRLDAMIEKDGECVEPNLKEHFIIAERARLKELITIGDPFYIWRGFLVDETDYVRMGKKEEGAAYSKQNAGKGVSYSLDRNVAGYFCYYGYAFKNGKVIDLPYDDYISTYIPPACITREEIISEKTRMVSELRNIDKRKPIVGKFLVCPKNIVGFNMDKVEAEVNFMPDDIAVQDYKILTSKEIAECMYETSQKSTTSIIDFQESFNKDGLVAFPYTYNGTMKVIFAEGKKVNDKLDEIKRIAIQNRGLSEQYWTDFLLELYKKNEVPAPPGFNPLKLTKDLYNLLRGKKDKD